jgi:alkylated DNA repair dioxygenase AlkB
MPPNIAGLRYVPNYLDAATHDHLFQATDSQPWQHSHQGRRIQIYGYTYDLAKGGIYRIGELPPWAAEISERVWRDCLMPDIPNQIVVNDYPPGAGIFMHVDAAALGDTVVSLSFGSTCIMELTEQNSAKVEELLLEPRSALVLAADARNEWKHSIPARYYDVWRGQDLMRGRRISVTLRAVGLRA